MPMVACEIECHTLLTLCMSLTYSSVHIIHDINIYPHPVSSILPPPNKYEIALSFS